jgi:hypothetical protein
LADTLATITAEARAILDDNDALVFTDAVLTPFANMGYQKVELEAVNRGWPSLRNVATATIPAGATALTASTTPAIPSDMFAPLEILERKSGTTDNYTIMTQVDELPEVDQDTFLQYWAQRDGASGVGIYFVGATEAQDIKIHYQRTLASLVNTTDPVGITRSGNFLALYTAAMAAGSRGSPAAGALMGQAKEELDTLITSIVRSLQHMPNLRRPYKQSGLGSSWF